MNPNDHLGNEYDAMTGYQKERHNVAGSTPIYPQSTDCNDGINRWTESKGGMTLRQHYAGLALQGMLANPAKDYNPDDLAREAWMYADLMIYILLQNTKH